MQYSAAGKNTHTHIKKLLHTLTSSSTHSYASRLISDSFQNRYYYRPGALNYTDIHYPHVKAYDAGEAKITSEKEAELILQLLNVCCMRKGRVIGAYITDKNGVTIYRKSSLPDCSKNPGTVIQFKLMYKINSRLKDIKASDKLILTLYNEILQEENAESKYYRYLNLLLIIAKNKDYPEFYPVDKLALYREIVRKRKANKRNADNKNVHTRSIKKLLKLQQ